MPYYGNGQAPQPTSYFTQDQQLLGSGSVPSEIAGAVGAGQAANIAGSGLTIAQLLQQIEAAPGQNAEQLAYNTSQYGIGVGQAGVSQAQNLLQQQGAAAQGVLNQQQQAEEVAQYTLAQQAFPEQQAQAAQQNTQALQGISSGGASAGTLNTTGHGRDIQNQALSYGWQQADISRAQQTAQLGQQSEVQGYQYSAGDIARTQQNLELAAQANGLSLQQLTGQYQYGQTTQNQGSELAQSQLYDQLLAAYGGSVGDLAGVGSQLGLLSPGSILSNGLSNGVNLNSTLFGSGG